MDFYKRALELKDETIQNRRNIHKNAEVGLDTPKTKAFVIEKLKELSEYELRSVSQLINCILRRYFDNINQDN